MRIWHGGRRVLFEEDSFLHLTLLPSQFLLNCPPEKLHSDYSVHHHKILLHYQLLQFSQKIKWEMVP